MELTIIIAIVAFLVINLDAVEDFLKPFLCFHVFLREAIGLGFLDFERPIRNLESGFLALESEALEFIHVTKRGCEGA